MDKKLQQLTAIGQSAWFDYIRRSFILDGELARLINLGVRGVTSNPAIFEKAIAGSNDYDAQLVTLCSQQRPTVDVYEALALRDIQMAADTLRVVYEETKGGDGYVSLEVSPDLAYDTEGTIAQARRLFAAIGRPNAFIKVPATPEGIPAIQTLIGEGININVTLMFSLDQYDAVAEAYISGLEQLAARGGDLSKVASVASFFVSRVDVKVDAMLRELGTPDAADLLGTVGIANAKMAYQRFKETFQGERWERLAARGARYQRVLWASTSTKDPTLPDTIYPDNLIGPHTVNTLPPETLDALIDHGMIAETLEQDIDGAQARLAKLAAVGIDLDQATRELLDEGVEKFAKPFVSLMASIEEKCHKLSGQRLKMRLGAAQDVVDAALDEIARDEIMQRINDHDTSVWCPEPTEIANRLGWLHSPAAMRHQLGDILAFVREVRDAGYTNVLLLGMGGSSLAPEVFSLVFGTREGYLHLDVLDSTDPGAVLAYEAKLDLAKTLFLVSSKSGTSIETHSALKYFYGRVREVVGPARAGEHFAVITDPGSKLLKLVERLNVRAVFLNDPTIGGRYSALSHFGLVPAALIGVDVGLLLDRALGMAWRCPDCAATGNKLAGQLGAAIGELAKLGRDKLTLVTSDALAPFGDWVEQLVAESTGKAGTGILPVVGEPLGEPGVYGDDRAFVCLRLAGDETHAAALAALAAAGYPVLTFELRDLYDLGEQIYLWGLAVPVASYRLDIHPFNQPNVETAKQQAQQMVTVYTETGALPEDEGLAPKPAALSNFLAEARPGDYIAIQAYVPPTPATTAALQALRVYLRDRTHLATTVGYGPRYLHSTGQLHKGDRGNGLFVQFTAEPAADAGIPDEAGASESSITFGVLERAQALGDRQALLQAGRRVIHFRLSQDVAADLQGLVAHDA